MMVKWASFINWYLVYPLPPNLDYYRPRLPRQALHQNFAVFEKQESLKNKILKNGFSSLIFTQKKMKSIPVLVVHLAVYYATDFNAVFINFKMKFQMYCYDKLYSCEAGVGR